MLGPSSHMEKHITGRLGGEKESKTAGAVPALETKTICAKAKNSKKTKEDRRGRGLVRAAELKKKRARVLEGS